MALRPCKECQKQISTDAKVCPHCGKEIGSSSSHGCLYAVLGVILIVVLSSYLRDHGSVSSPNPTIDPKTTTLSQVKLEYKWRKEGFGNVMEADFTLKNNSNYDIKDFEITCEHYANSGTRIDSNTRTVYEVAKAHSARKFPNFNMGFIHSQASQSSCKVTDLSIVQ